MKELENRISSREVAEMMEVTHANLLQKIDNINNDFREMKIQFSKYWIESTYKVDGQNRGYKEYLITKRGCEFLAHKTTGTKGNLFTDKYMDRFEQMKEYITKEQYTVSRPKEELECLDVIADILHFNDNSKLLGVRSICDKYGMETSYLPAYTPSKGVLKSATELLKEHNADISVIKFNKKLVELGILKECTRQSTKDKTKVKKFKNLVDTTWGENEINLKNPKETQPLYYENKFKELLEIVQA